MIRYALRRAASSVLALAAVHAVSYLAIQYLAVREYGTQRVGTYAGVRRLVSDPAAKVEVALGEVFKSYTQYAGLALRGDFGDVRGTDTVLEVIATSLPPSLLLLSLALGVACLGGVAIGYWSYSSSGRQTTGLAVGFNVMGYAMPAFYLGILSVQGMFLLSRLFERHGTLLPASGYGLDEHLLLPVFVLALRPMAEVARLTSELIHQEMGKEYIRAAEARGLPWHLVLAKHALPNIAGVLIVAVANSMRYLLSSLIVVELLFGWPGVGRALAIAVAPRIDGRPSAPTLYQPELVAGLVTALAALALVVHYFTGFVVRAVDPRQRH